MRTIAILLTALAIAPVAFPQSPNSELNIDQGNRTISVSASDHAEAEPDIADLHVGYTAYGATLQDAYKSASDSSNGITKAMLAAGAQKADIQSQSQRVARLSDYEIKTQKGMKFSVQQSWTVSVAPKDAALILDAAVQAGANQSGDINWRMRDSVALDQEAIRRATTRALAMIATLAKTMGVTMVKPVFATNTSSGNIVSPMMMKNRTFMSVQADAAPQPLVIEAQRVESNATVQIVYAIE